MQYESHRLTKKNKLLILKAFNDIPGWGIWERMCMAHRRRCKSKTLRQKDWIRTGLWKAFLHRRSNLRFRMWGIFQVKQQRHENKDTCSVVIFPCLCFFIFFHMIQILFRGGCALWRKKHRFTIAMWRPAEKSCLSVGIYCRYNMKQVLSRSIWQCAQLVACSMCPYGRACTIRSRCFKSRTAGYL